MKDKIEKILKTPLTAFVFFLLVIFVIGLILENYEEILLKIFPNSKTILTITEVIVLSVTVPIAVISSLSMIKYLIKTIIWIIKNIIKLFKKIINSIISNNKSNNQE